MKDFLKPLLTWFFGLFNIGLYNMSDQIDSIVNALTFLNLNEQANEVVRIQHLIEQQYQIIIILNVVKCALMLMTLLFLYLANSHEIHRFFLWCRNKFKSIYSFFKTKFKS